MEVDSQPSVETRVKVKPRKPRSTDHKVVRIHIDSDTVTQDDEGEFVEKKSRGRRAKRKTPSAAVQSSSSTTEGTDSAVAMDTEAPVLKKPHFAKLADRHEMVSPLLGETCSLLADCLRVLLLLNTRITRE